jgi:Pectobacterium phage endonuclease
MPRHAIKPLPWRGHQHAAHVDRFWSKVAVGEPDACWPWMASRRDKGYGQIAWFGGVEKAHRVAFVLAYGYWPENALHTCDHPWCCNPGHLKDGSIAENNRQMANRGRHWQQAYPSLVRRGERHNMAVLTEDDVLTMREAFAGGGVTRKELAVRFGVSLGHVQSLIRRRTWKHVP